MELLVYSKLKHNTVFPITEQWIICYLGLLMGLLCSMLTLKLTLIFVKYKWLDYFDVRFSKFYNWLIKCTQRNFSLFKEILFPLPITEQLTSEFPLIASIICNESLSRLIIFKGALRTMALHIKDVLGHGLWYWWHGPMLHFYTLSDFLLFKESSRSIIRDPDFFEKLYLEVKCLWKSNPSNIIGPL